MVSLQSSCDRVSLKPLVNKMLKLAAAILGLVLVYLKYKFSKKKRQADIEKDAVRDIRRVDESLAEGDIGAVAYKFAELRRRVLQKTSALHGRVETGEDR